MKNREELERFLRQTFLNQKINFEGDGWSSFAFTVGDKIIRFPKVDINCYEKESKMLEFLKNKVSFEIPQTNIVVDASIPYIVHIKLYGIKWSIESYNKLNQKKRDLFCKDIAIFFAELHRISLKDINNIISLREMERTLIAFEELEKVLKDEFTFKENEKLYSIYLNSKTSNKEKVLLHNDFYENNSLVNEKHRLKCIFDFGNVRVGEREKEFRSLYYDEYGDLFRKVLKNYENITKIKLDLDRFDKINMIEDFECIVYLGNNLDLKNSMQNNWEKIIEKLKLVLKK